MQKKTHLNVGVIGCGQISSIYFANAQKFDVLNITACADIDMERAQAQAQRFDIPKTTTVDELLADPEIDIILNLTIPAAHATIAQETIAAGKHAYSEKPLGINRQEGLALLETAKARHLSVGCAPDTFLGGGIQTCIQLINEGQIGIPVAATAFMLGHGPESWHANPEFFYQPGAGPMFDMGPYYLTALIAMLGPVRRVTGSTRITFPERTITSQPKYGEIIKVQTPTHISGIMDFANGAIGTIITSFDVWSHHLPRLEIYGSEGSLLVPDPNTFGGPVYLRHANDTDWKEVTLTHGYTENSRGLGIADMAYAILSGRPHRAHGDLAFHVLDIIEAFHDASREGKHIELTSTCARPAALPVGLHDWHEAF